LFFSFSFLYYNNSYQGYQGMVGVKYQW